MNEMMINSELLGFIEQSASMYHTIANIEMYLTDAGFTRLSEGKSWNVAAGGRYYVTRNNSSIIAFEIPQKTAGLYFKIIASHSDSPTFAVKDIPELDGPGEYLRLNVEGYGGMISYSWLDRPLSIAGRVMVKCRADDGSISIRNRLLYIDRDILLIPSQCIHFNREVNKGVEFNTQVDMCPLFSAGALQRGDFDRMIAEELNVEPEDIMGKNLFLVNRQKGCIWGEADEFISSPKLDDLQCAFASLMGFIQASSNENHLPDGGINVYACFDNEEVGSGTKQGALSTFLADTLKRICMSLDETEESYHMALASSFMISADNAHALHPNHPEKTDKCNRPVLNGGIVIKENAAQKYVTDAFSRALFRSICEKAEVPCQSFANRSNVAGGSTLGNLSNTQVSIHAVDIGLPQLAMHSSYETAGAKDTVYAVTAFEKFYMYGILIDECNGCTIVDN